MGVRCEHVSMHIMKSFLEDRRLVEYIPIFLKLGTVVVHGQVWMPRSITISSIIRYQGTFWEIEKRSNGNPNATLK